MSMAVSVSTVACPTDLDLGCQPRNRVVSNEGTFVPGGFRLQRGKACKKACDILTGARREVFRSL